MRLEIPITGTVIAVGEDGWLSGDQNDPIRLIGIDLGNVSWKSIGIDLDKEVMVIEVTPAEEIDEDTGQVDATGRRISIRKKTTEQDKQRFLDEAEAKVKNKTKEQLYAETESPRLKLNIPVDAYKFKERVLKEEK